MAEDGHRRAQTAGQTLRERSTCNRARSGPATLDPIAAGPGPATPDPVAAGPGPATPDPVAAGPGPATPDPVAAH